MVVKKVKIPKKGTAEYKKFYEDRRKKRKDRDAKAFAEKVAKVKKEKSKEELLEIVSKQPENHEIQDLLVARKALDELKVPYSNSFK